MVEAQGADERHAAARDEHVGVVAEGAADAVLLEKADLERAARRSPSRRRILALCCPPHTDLG
jgi:hypothetical protein